jgi:hypothetical protein
MLRASGSAAPAVPGARPAAPLKIVFAFMGLQGRLRFFDAVIEGLVERGHRVHVVLEQDGWGSGVERAWRDRMAEKPGFSEETVSALDADRWAGTATRLHCAAEYVRWGQPKHANRIWFRSRATSRAPRWIQRLMSPGFMWHPRAVGVVSASLEGFRKAVPIGRHVRTLLMRTEPDVLLVCPRMTPGSLSHVYIDAAQSLGIPAAICVPSWDNLSSKQLLGVVPDGLFVWNKLQRREAREIHGIPSDRVVVTGAQCFDHWFDWQPRPREEFCARVGLDPEKPFVLYAGGALMHEGPSEAAFAAEWIRRLRSSRHPEVRELSVLVRPHPKRNELWSTLDLDGVPDTAMWPPVPMQLPVEQGARADYFDSLYHSVAVVGLNTTAMVEAAILERPVFTLLLPEFADSQTGTFHFDYLFKVAGGIVRAAESFEEHEGQLAEALITDSVFTRKRSRRFVREFLRPYGRETPALPRFIDEVEQFAARTPPGAPPPSPWRPATKALLVAGTYALQPREAARGASLRLRRLTG